jgi:uncharacterized tellurite resistance protein B-like protein
MAINSILDLFRFNSSAEKVAGDTESVRKIVKSLESLAPQEAQYVAAFSYLLGRVAHADLEISAEEVASMEGIVQRFGGLPESQTKLVVEIVKSQNELFGGTENFQVAREFKSLSSRQQRQELLHCLFAVAAADDEISGIEEEQVRRIADELGLTHREFSEIRSLYNEKRSVLRQLDGKP